jgi:hypothetical protein
MNKDIYQELSVREQLRSKLLQAKALVTSLDIEGQVTVLSAEEILEIGQLPSDAPSSTQLIDEDRGKY